MALSETMPDVAVVLFGPIDSELHDGNYGEKEAVLEFISQYKKRNHTGFFHQFRVDIS